MFNHAILDQVPFFKDHTPVRPGDFVWGYRRYSHPSYYQSICFQFYSFYNCIRIPGKNQSDGPEMFVRLVVPWN
jgi:hypothetical protein